MSTAQAVSVERVHDIHNEVGESPVWSAAEQALYWVDIPVGRIYRHDARQQVLDYRELGQAIGSLGLREQGGLVLALRSGLHLLDSFFSDTLPVLLTNPEPDRPQSRLNDGKVGPDGCFWVGSMDEREVKEDVGQLYRLTPDYQCQRMAGGVKVSNGLAWSPDGRTLYHSDSRGGAIWCYDYHPVTGELGQRQLFVAMQPEWGRPDGAAVDAEGCYWSCGIGAGRINRFSPAGELISHIELPVSHPTMPCFGGVNLDTLYITSLSEGFTPLQWEASPLAGGLFALKPGVSGTPVALYKG